MFQARFEIVARRSIRRPSLVLGSGWFNGIVVQHRSFPSPARTTSENDGIVLGVPASSRWVGSLAVYIPFQVNPTTVGQAAQDVVLRDGGRPIAAVER